jgi:hypothetical protein
MQTTVQTAPQSTAMLWAGRVTSALPILFLLLDGVMKLIKPAIVVQETVRLGYPENTILPIGIVLLSCTILYLVPPTSVLGAILLTGYLGGAVATHVHMSEAVFPIIFPIVICVLVWGGLYLRDSRLRTLIPIRISGR